MSTTIASSAGTAAATPFATILRKPRLIDADPSRFRSLKQVIVLGCPGSGVDGKHFTQCQAPRSLTHCAALGDALRTLGYKVYDFKAASDRYERDFPLWVEAARLCNEGTPYNQSDYDKVIGDHDALVGAPTSFFDHKFIKLYPNVKVIVVTRKPTIDTTAKLCGRYGRFWKRFDPTYLGNMSRFIDMASSMRLDYDAVRETVRERNLLEIECFDSWEPLCEFLNVAVPRKPVPCTEHNSTTAELAARPRNVASTLAKEVVYFVMSAFKWACIFAVITLSSLLLIISGKEVAVPCVGLCVLVELVSYIVENRDMYKPNSTATSSPDLGVLEVETHMQTNSYRQHKRIHSNRRNNRRGNRRNKSRPDYDYEPQNVTLDSSRPVRAMLPGWDNVQEDILKDDVASYHKRMALAEEFKDQRVTFNVTHKNTKYDEQSYPSKREVSSTKTVD
jgi:hypothetical protein